MVGTNKFETEFGPHCCRKTKYWGIPRPLPGALPGAGRQARGAPQRRSTRKIPTRERCRKRCANWCDAGDPLVRDAWGTTLRLDRPGWVGSDQYQLRSAGPDKRFDDADDMIVYLQVHTGKTLPHPVPGGTIELSMEHDRGPFNGLAEIAGNGPGRDWRGGGRRYGHGAIEHREDDDHTCRSRRAIPFLRRAAGRLQSGGRKRGISHCVVRVDSKGAGSRGAFRESPSWRR